MTIFVLEHSSIFEKKDFVKNLKEQPNGDLMTLICLFLIYRIFMFIRTKNVIDKCTSDSMLGYYKTMLY